MIGFLFIGLSKYLSDDHLKLAITRSHQIQPVLRPRSKAVKARERAQKEKLGDGNGERGFPTSYTHRIHVWYIHLHVA